MDDLLIAFGSEVKALDGGDGSRIGGYAVLFGSPDLTDVSDKRDYFTKSTDFYMDEGETRTFPLMFNHGLDPKLGRTQIGTASVKMDDVGLWMDGILKVRSAYEATHGKFIKPIREGVRLGKFGISGGAGSHTVGREAKSNGSNWVGSWGLCEISLTPTPAEPRTLAHCIKTLAEFKASALGDNSGRYALDGALLSLNDSLHARLSEHMGDKSLTPEQRKKKARECFASHGATGVNLFAALLDPDHEGDQEAVKAILESFATEPPESVGFVERLSQAESALVWAAGQPDLNGKKYAAVKSLLESGKRAIRRGFDPEKFQALCELDDQLGNRMKGF